MWVKDVIVTKTAIQLLLAGIVLLALPAATSPAASVTKIAAGGYHSLLLKNDGSLWAMGDNRSGELGDGTHNNTNLPEQIVVSNVTAIAAGGGHSLFLKSDGSVWGMGASYDG